MARTINIALIGFGTVGSGTAELLHQHRADVEARIGAPVRLTWVCSRSKKKSPFLPKDVRQTRDWKDVVSDPAVDCVVELMGGLHPALEVVQSALEHGKHVVTANKAIISKHWDPIFDTARRCGRLVCFEAAVGGGVPIVQALDEGLAGNRVHRIEGILNGTTNFILTRMIEQGATFAHALRDAQKAGFAEANPSFDIDGIDAAQKIAILASIAAGAWIAPDKVYAEGITRINPIDIRLIQERLRSTVKLLGIAEDTDAGWILRVHPTVIPATHPFATVRNEYNAIALHGDAVGDVLLYGKGAGRAPTASAVLSDIIYLCRMVRSQTAGRLPSVSRFALKSPKLAEMADVRSRYYLRITTQDKPGVLAQVTGILGKNNVSLASVHQDVPEGETRSRVTVVLVTHVSTESDVSEAVRLIDRLPSTRGRTTLLRML